MAQRLPRHGLRQERGPRRSFRRLLQFNESREQFSAMGYWLASSAIDFCASTAYDVPG